MQQSKDNERDFCQCQLDSLLLRYFYITISDITRITRNTPELPLALEFLQLYEISGRTHVQPTDTSWQEATQQFSPCRLLSTRTFWYMATALFLTPPGWLGSEQQLSLHSASQIVEGIRCSAVVGLDTQKPQHMKKGQRQSFFEEALKRRRKKHTSHSNTERASLSAPFFIISICSRNNTPI